MASTIPISIMAHLDALAQENGLSKAVDVWAAVNARLDHAIRFIRGGFSIELKKQTTSDANAKNTYLLIVRDIDAGLRALTVDVAQGALFAHTDILTIIKLNQAGRKAQAALTGNVATLIDTAKPLPVAVSKADISVSAIAQ